MKASEVVYTDKRFVAGQIMHYLSYKDKETHTEFYILSNGKIDPREIMEAWVEKNEDR